MKSFSDFGKQLEEVLNNDKSHIEQHLADKDINSSVSGNTVKVHSSDVTATKKHLEKAGYKHNVVSGLNEDHVDEAMSNPGLEALASKVKAARTGKPSNPGLEKLAHEKAKAKYLNKEESEELDELSNKLLNRYSKKAEKEAGKNFMAADRAQDRGNYDKAQTHMDKADKRASGVYRAQSKIKEESLDEISKDTLSSYAHKAFAQGNDLHYDLAHSKGDKATDAERQAIKDKISKRNVGVIKASQKMNKEDIELHEDAYDTGYSHGGVGKPKANPHPVGSKSHRQYEDGYDQGHDDKKANEAIDTVKKDASGNVIAWSHEGDWKKMSGRKQGQGKASNLAGKALQQTRKLTKEEKDEGEYGYEGDMAISQLKTICRHSEHLIGMLKPDTDLPEWVQSKITLATDYMQTAHDYMMSEMNESLDEEAHVYDTKTGKVHSTHDTYRKAINAMNKLNDKHAGYDTPGGLVQDKFGAKRVNEDVDLEEKRGLWDNIHAKRKRIAAGSGERMRKPGSEGAPTDRDLKNAAEGKEYNMKSFNEFMSALQEELDMIDEGRADDVKDKLAAAREKRLSGYDYSKEKEKPKSNVTVHKARYNMDDDEKDDDDEVKKSAEREVKRGRGRPKGLSGSYKRRNS